MLLLACLAVMLPQSPAVLVSNPGSSPRQEVLRISMPWPRGQHQELAAVKVAGVQAPCVPLLRWPDGSLALVQIHTRVRLAAGAQQRLLVEPLQQAVEEPAFAQTLPAQLPLFSEVEDPWGRVYRAKLQPDTSAGPAGVVLETSLLRVRRFRAQHRSLQDGAVMFGVLAYLTTFADESRAELLLCLDNARHLPGPVLGPCRFRSFSLVSTDRRLLIRPRFAAENLLAPPQAEGPSDIDGPSDIEGKEGRRQVLLGPGDQFYLGDATAKAWHLDLGWQELAAGPALTAFADLAWVRHTGAWGMHGGPAPGPQKETQRTSQELQVWRQHSDFGPFGGFGDPKQAAAQGTPRNGPCALHNVLRFQSPALLRKAQGMVLQHCLRPLPASSPRLPADTKSFRQGLSQRSQQMPHGFTALDYEHFSVNLLYDYYWLTGDPLALLELRRMGEGLPRLLAGLPFMTCRGEGWCMQATAQIARATGAEELQKLVLQRFHTSVLPQMGKLPSCHVLAQPPHPQALGPLLPFDAPWQMAALVHGLHAMQQTTGDAKLLAAAEQTALVMAGPGWLRGKGPKYLLSARDAGRYMMPVGFGPLEGTALMQLGAFVLAEEMASNPDNAKLFHQRAQFLQAGHAKKDAALLATRRWWQLWLDRHGESQRR